MSNASGSLNSLASSSVIDLAKFSVTRGRERGEFAGRSRNMTLAMGAGARDCWGWSAGGRCWWRADDCVDYLRRDARSFSAGHMEPARERNGALVGFAAGIANDDRGHVSDAAGVYVVRSGGNRGDVCGWVARKPRGRRTGAGCDTAPHAAVNGNSLNGNESSGAAGPHETQPGLVRGLGSWAAAAIVVGTMIGTGIFLKPSEMAAEGGSVSVVFAAWIAGGLLSLFGALSYAELGAAMPEAGGEYAYLRRAFGPVWGFLFGWMHSIVGRPASAAAIAAGLLRFWSFLCRRLRRRFTCFTCAFPSLRSSTRSFAFTWAQPLAVAALAADDVHQLPRRAIWRRGAGDADVAEGCVGAGDYRGGIRFGARELCELSSAVARLARMGHFRRISRGAGGIAVGLRRMGGPQSGRLGGQRSGTKHPTGASGGSAFTAVLCSCCSTPCASMRFLLARWRDRSTWHPMWWRVLLGTERRCGSRWPWRFRAGDA
jgi:hypothetical protein